MQILAKQLKSRVPPLTGPQFFHLENGDGHTRLKDLTLAPPGLGTVPTSPAQPRAPGTRPCAGFPCGCHLPPCRSCLGERQGKASFQPSRPGFLLNNAPPAAPWTPAPRGLSAFPLSPWQSLVGPGAARDSLSPLGTPGRGSTAKNQFQEACQIPGNQAGTQVPRGPSPRTSQPLERTWQRLLLLWVNLLACPLLSDKAWPPLPSPRNPIRSGRLQAEAAGSDGA